MKRRIALGFGFAALLMAVLITAVGGQDVFDELSRADYSVLGLGVLSGIFALAFRGFVWNRFLTLVDNGLSRKRITGVFLTAMFLKYVTPYGQLATEPFVAYLVVQESEMAYEDGLAGIISADLLNYLPYYSFGFLALGIVATGDALGNDLFAQFVAFSALFVAVISIIAVGARRPDIVYGIVLFITSVLRRVLGKLTPRFDEQLSRSAVRTRLDGFYATITMITADRRTLLITAVYAHIGMIFLMLPVYIGAAALGHQLSLPVVALVVALGKLGAIVPAPGGTGGVEAMVTASLTTLGQLEPAAALTIAIIYRVCTYWLTVGIGGISAASVLFRGE
ncbi:lysylphosphatidylglycerol synthase transmembrane domain-containing protein [Halostagnicola sp. A-GB9-2]|uniref:lysylphosphatidylglycerol synthase transmembrane domain-containing protein n=1 Tax=Halostagnicola sp. A-GB9-2 TaxID=3048066 RepID=UPI0024BF9ECF|nr:lysylphosphatidylglycerol synthase transmembrane domain-containing protein [Halostagnicola sp. A-GB9-2]MDJ1433474.1 lysylphosphatidylglycerol synthase transmembrane domain-containing protein [Halostagnicola sp. A-GB9-2]